MVPNSILQTTDHLPAEHYEVIWSQAARHATIGDATAATVRHADQGDLLGIVAIAAACDLDWTAKSLQKEVERHCAKVLVVDSDGTIAAMLVAWLIADEVQILEVAVLPRFRRRGLATLLLCALLQPRCTDSAGGSAWLEVRASNHGAVALYEKLDFERRATRRDYYADGEDAIIMCKDLA